MQGFRPSLDLNEHLVAHPAATFFMRVTGDSMIDHGIREGDVLVIDRSMTPVEGDVIIACVEGEFEMKILRSDRPVDCFGKVTACIHRF